MQILPLVGSLRLMRCFADTAAEITANVKHVAYDIVVVASNSTKLIHPYSIFIYSFHPIHTQNSLT